MAYVKNIHQIQIFYKTMTISHGLILGKYLNKYHLLIAWIIIFNDFARAVATVIFLNFVLP